MTTLVIFRFGRAFRFFRIGRGSGLTRRVGRLGGSFSYIRSAFELLFIGAVAGLPRFNPLILPTFLSYVLGNKSFFVIGEKYRMLEKGSLW